MTDDWARASSQLMTVATPQGVMEESRVHTMADIQLCRSQLRSQLPVGGEQGASRGGGTETKIVRLHWRSAFRKGR